jgi:hypothetical protein
LSLQSTRQGEELLSADLKNLKISVLIYKVNKAVGFGVNNSQVDLSKSLDQSQSLNFLLIYNSESISISIVKFQSSISLDRCGQIYEASLKHRILASPKPKTLLSNFEALAF